MKNAITNTEKIFSEITKNFPPYEADLDNSVASREIPPWEDWGDLGDFDLNSLGDPAKFPLPTGELDGEVGASIDIGTSKTGTEALAFYKSWRYRNLRPFRGTWGIYYLTPAISYYANVLVQDGVQQQNANLIALAWLKFHEYCHFQADIHTLFLEAITKCDRYDTVHRLFNSRPEDFVEEAIANKASITPRSLSGNKILSATRQQLGNLGIFNPHQLDADWTKSKIVFKRIMQAQPARYADFAIDNDVLLSEWAGVTADLNPKHARDDLALWPDDILHYSGSIRKKLSCPEHIISPRSSKFGGRISPIYQLPKVIDLKESESFNKKITKMGHEKTWQKAKNMLLSAPPFTSGLDFKKETWLPYGTYSIRLDDGDRARLEPVDMKKGLWVAVDAGPHEKMKH